MIACSLKNNSYSNCNFFATSLHLVTILGGLDFGEETFLKN